MTTLKGHPDVPAGTALNVRLIWDVPLQGAGRGLSPRHRDATYDWNAGKYMDGQVELTFPHPRAGQNDNALRGPLVAVYTIGTGPLSQTARYPLQAYETAPGELDITVDPNPATVVAAQTLIDLIASMNEALAAVRGATSDTQDLAAEAVASAQEQIDAALAPIAPALANVAQAVGDIKADIAQQRAALEADLGLTSVQNVAALLGRPAGGYRVLDGDRRVWWDGSAITAEAPAAAAASRTSRAIQVPLLPSGTAAQNAAILRATVDAAPEGSRLELPQGTYALTSIGQITKSLTISGVGCKLVVTIATAPTGGDPLFWFEPTQTAPTHALTACTQGALTVTLAAPADAAGYAPGDWIRISDNATVRPWDWNGTSSPSGVSGYNGRSQITQVQSVNAAAGTLTVLHPLEWEYNATPQVRRMTMLDSPSVVGFAEIAEVDPGFAHTGPDQGGSSSHIIHYRWCLTPVTTGNTFRGWNKHAINATECINPHEHGNNGFYPFRPQIGGHGYLTRNGNCTGSLNENSRSWGVRHHVDWSQSYDGLSRANYAYDVDNIAFYEHGLGEKRCRSTGDSAVGRRDFSSAGWGAGNPTFGASYGFEVVSGTYRGRGTGLAHGYGSVGFTATAMDIACDTAIGYNTGASDLTINGGRYESTRANGNVLKTTSTSGKIPSGLKITGRAEFVQSGTSENALSLLDITGDIEIDGLGITGGSNQIYMAPAATPRNVILRRLRHGGTHARSLTIAATPSGVLEVDGGTYQGYTSGSGPVSLPSTPRLRFTNNNPQNADGTPRSDLSLTALDAQAIVLNNRSSLDRPTFSSLSLSGALTMTNGTLSSAINQSSSATDSILDINPAPASGTGSSTTRIGRGISTSGLVTLDLLMGNGANTTNARLSNGTSYTNLTAGNFGVGTNAPANKLQVAGSIGITGGVLKHAVFTKATLPSASASGSGAETTISDPAATKGPKVYSNGSAWLYARDDSTV